jgi:streptogramin lyase
MMFALSLAILLSMLIPEQAAATIIIERALPNDPVRAPFGIDVARNASFVVFALKHVGRIGWLGTGQCLIKDPVSGISRDNHTYLEFSLPGLDGSTSEPRDVALGNKTLRSGSPGYEGFVYFTEFVRNKIGRLDIGYRDTPGYSWGRIDEFTIPTPSSGPMNLAIDPYNGSIWFTEYQANKIGRLFFVGETTWRFIEYSLPTPNSYPTDIAVDPNCWHVFPAWNLTVTETQTHIWFTMSGSNKIGRLNGETGEIVEYWTRGTPWGITVTEESFVWFTQKLGDRIAKLNPWTAVITEVPVPVHSPGSEPFYIKNDTDGSLWFTESTENRIGRYIPGQNLFQEFVVPTTASKPHGLVLTLRLYPSVVGSGINPDYFGKMDVFFTEEVGNKIGKIIIPSGPWTTTTTVGFVSSASTTTSSATTVTTTATTVSTSSTAVIAIVGVTGASITVGNFTTTLVDTVSILQTSTTSTWTKTTTSTTVSTMTSTSTSTSTTTSTSPTTSTASTTSTSTESYTTTTTTTTSTTFTSTSYSPTVTTTTTVGMLSTYMTTTTTTTTYTAAQTSQVYLTTTTATTVIVTTTPTPSRACVIASAAYGSELAPPVQFLREFRDGAVMSTFAGTQFMRVFNAFYYSFSPKVAELTAASPILQTGVRAAIYPLISALRFVAAAHQTYPGSQLMIVVAGVVASGLIGALYLTPVAILMGMMRKRVRISGGV